MNELKHVPFQLLEEHVRTAEKLAVDKYLEVERRVYERWIEQKEREWADTHEAPDEGALRELHPFTPSNAVKEERRVAGVAALDEFLETHKFRVKSTWLMPQIASYIAKMPTCGFDGLEFLKKNFSVDDWHKGLYRYCTYSKRSKILKDSQITEISRNYSALVPILIAPFKRFDGVLYSRWTNIEYLLDQPLKEALACDIDMSTFSMEDIIDAREHGMKVKSSTSTKYGQSRSPVSTYKLFGHPDGSPVKELPWLCQVMLTQIWLAHPSIRTDAMILNWTDIDKIPASLIDGEVIPEQKKKKQVKDSTGSYIELPWE